MDLLINFIERRTKQVLTDIQKKAIAQIEKGESLEMMHFYDNELSVIPYWQLDLFSSLVDEYKKLDAKKQKILSDLEHQKVEDKEVLEAIQKSIDLFDLEDLYRPYKRRKKTKATVAREAGLTEIADWIWSAARGEQDAGGVSLEVKAKDYIKPQLGFVTYDIVLKGAQDIIVERLLKRSEVRNALRDKYYDEGVVTVSKTEKFKEGKYSTVAQFREKVTDLMNSKNYYKFPIVKKAWEEGFFKVLVEAKVADLLEQLRKETFNFKEENDCTKFLDQAFQKAIDIHVLPSITQEIVEELLKVSENVAIKMLKQDYQRLLMAPAFGPQPVMSFIQSVENKIDVTLVTNQGELVSSTQIDILDETSKSVFTDVLKDITAKIQLGALAVGLNEFVRSTESFLVELLKKENLNIPIAIVDMRGITAYVTSDEAKKEFGERPKTERSLVSLARRLQDPLKELCKYPPKSIIDVQSYVTDEKLLPELDKVLKHCVALVGVDLNDSSETLLLNVNGMNEELVQKILTYRKEKGRFVEKMQLNTELHFSDDLMKQCAGFFRVALSKSILDKTSLRLHRFSAIKDMAKDLGIPLTEELSLANEDKIFDSKYKEIFSADELAYIVKSLKNAGKSPRRTFKFFGFNPSIKELKDIKVGEIYPALVTRFSSFGAFVDLGVNQDGLIHLSELSEQFIADPRKSVGLGDWVFVKVIDVNLDKKLLSLSKIKAERAPRKDSGKNFKGNKPAFSKKPHGEQSHQASGDRKENPRFKDNRKGNFNKNKGGNQKGGGKPADNKKPKTPFNNPFAALSNLNIKD